MPNTARTKRRCGLSRSRWRCWRCWWRLPPCSAIAPTPKRCSTRTGLPTNGTSTRPRRSVPTTPALRADLLSVMTLSDKDKEEKIAKLYADHQSKWNDDLKDEQEKAEAFEKKVERGRGARHPLRSCRGAAGNQDWWSLPSRCSPARVFTGSWDWVLRPWASCPRSR